MASVAVVPGSAGRTLDPPAAIHPPTRAERWVLLFLVTFLLLLPKGGLKVAGIPITWGYLGLGMVTLWLPWALLTGRSVRLRMVRVAALVALVPFQLVSWAGLMANGIDDPGFAIAFLTSFFMLPLAFLLVLGIHLDRIELDLLLRAVKFSVLAVSAYGIFLFFFKLLTGEFIEIPYLTVNAGDVGELEGKHIDRGGIFKLISTYNNGNIFGVSMLILLPLYAWLEPRASRQAVVKFALLLTLSRTVWAGLLAYEVLHRIYVRRPTPRAMATMIAATALAAGGVAATVAAIGLDAAFLFDITLGGRIGQLASLGDATLLPREEFDAIGEIVYLSVLRLFGMTGLLAFIAGMAAPLALHFAGGTSHRETPYRKSLALGLVVYLIVAMSDGAALFIPTMAIYWFVASLLLSDNPSFA